MDKANGIRGLCPGRLGRRALDILSGLISERLAMGWVDCVSRRTIEIDIGKYKLSLLMALCFGPWVHYSIVEY